MNEHDEFLILMIIYTMNRRFSCQPQGVTIIAQVRCLHDQTNVTEDIVTLDTAVCVESAQGCDNT